MTGEEKSYVAISGRYVFLQNLVYNFSRKSIYNLKKQHQIVKCEKHEIVLVSKPFILRTFSNCRIHRCH